ncbi:MAG: EAL domain-containing protein [Chromatiales bacterium]|nr:EAL domain-containing protein [Chromatiales bacterium]
MFCATTQDPTVVTGASTQDITQILVVDDDPVVRELAFASLEDDGLRVHLAEAGDYALDRFEHQPADLVMLDVMMPGLDGFEVCRRIRALPGGEHVPVLMVTGLDDVESIERAFDAGATDFLTKPIQWAVLRHHVQYILRAAKDRRDLQTSQERYALAAQATQDGIWDWDLEAGQVYFAPRWLAILGYRSDELEPHIEAWLGRIHPDDSGRVRLELEAHLEGISDSFESEHRVRSASGDYRWVLARGLAVRDEQGRATRVAGSLSDINRRKFAEQQLIHDAFHDTLTGLPNRALFLDRIEHALRTAVRRPTYGFAVAFLDLDRFKVVNDSLGHGMGDVLLMEVSRRVRDCLREGDTLARLGGDEFTLLFEDISSETDVTRLLERIQQELERGFTLDDHEVSITASIGVTFSGSGYTDADDMLRDADTAMYRAKYLGKARYEIFDAQMRAHVLNVLQVEAELREAIREKEFFLVYQPVVSLDDGRVVGLEVLLRWNHPRRGVLIPEQFLAAAEESGLILPMGHWVLHEALRQLAEWREFVPLAADWFVSVNLSARELGQPDLVRRVTNALKDHDLRPADLVLEVTESGLIGNPSLAAELLHGLKDLGVGLSIDNFGTGHSSFKFLHRYPFKQLKIDRSYVELDTGAVGGQPLLKAIVDLAHNLGLSVVAEGGEQDGENERLRNLSCEYAQGNFWYEPKTADGLLATLTEGDDEMRDDTRSGRKGSR